MSPAPDIANPANAIPAHAIFTMLTLSLAVLYAVRKRDETFGRIAPEA